VRVRSLQDGAAIADLTAGRRPALALTLSPDGDLMAIGDGEGYVNVTATEDWLVARDFRAVPRGPIWALAFHEAPDGLRLLAGGLDSHIDVWPLATASSVRASDDLRRPFQRKAGLSNGERQFVRKCSICHTLTPDDGARAGPTLYGLFGRPAGSLADYPYSDALNGSDIVWTAQTVSALFDVGPDHYTPGSKMPMQRITDAQDRADLIAWLQEATRPADRESTP
jgi:cytochrome c